MAAGRDHTEAMDHDAPPRIAQHEAADRFGTTALRTAHELTVALAGNDDADEEPVVRRTGGPHRSIGGLAALLDAALADEDAGPAGMPDGTRPRPGA
ncbi:hypothetical protein SAMN05428965_1759 [Geodermatophilus sp. DSM 45219]|nr:hypothetical protein SAMN05428965_1759 [Geodermatophilus sp. DSM 45219]